MARLVGGHSPVSAGIIKLAAVSIIEEVIETRNSTKWWSTSSSEAYASYISPDLLLRIAAARRRTSLRSSCVVFFQDLNAVRDEWRALSISLSEAETTLCGMAWVFGCTTGNTPLPILFTAALSIQFSIKLAL